MRGFNPVSEGVALTPPHPLHFRDTGEIRAASTCGRSPQGLATP